MGGTKFHYPRTFEEMAQLISFKAACQKNRNGTPAWLVRNHREKASRHYDPSVKASNRINSICFDDRDIA